VANQEADTLAAKVAFFILMSECLLLFLMFIFLFKFMVKPIRTMSANLAKMSKNPQLSGSLDESSKDELGDLACQFNQRTDQLFSALENLRKTTTSMDSLNAEIAERKRTEEKLRLTQFAVDNASDMSFWISEDAKFVYANNVACEALGYSRQELLSMSVCDIDPELPKGKWQEHWERIKREDFVIFESSHRSKAGQVYPVEISSGYFNYGGKGYICASVRNILDRKQKEKELEKMHKDLMLASHRAGMAEVATDVLHNVGNVLNSVNVSANLIENKILNSKSANLKKVTGMIADHSEDLGTFLTKDQRGKHIPTYLTEAARLFAEEQEDVVEQLRSLTKNVEHIKEIVRTQQVYAKTGGVQISTDIDNVIEYAIEISNTSLEQHDIEFKLEVAELPEVCIDKQRILQILVNLINNGKHALSESKKQGNRLTIRSYKYGEDRFRIEVTDNGIGILRENLIKVFQHGFTTKQDGHGFGLHSGALSAKEMGGSLNVHSDGLEQGASFILELPLNPNGVARCTG
jgi:PAS domain S-box-containing protein